MTRPGTHFDGSGVHFAVFSAHAERVELVLFDANHHPVRTVNVTGRSGDIWHVYVAGARPGQRYGYRVHGPWSPVKGHRFNAGKVLLDPFARAISRMPVWNRCLYGYDTGADDLAICRSDSAHYAPVGVVMENMSTLRSPLNIPWSDTIIYETHIKGLTQLHPDVPAELRGTYLGAASAPILDHLKRLGVTAVELLPVHAAVQDERLVRSGLSQYWGYNTLSFFAPDPRFASGDGISAVREFQLMVDALHEAGLEVILDVVFNHTGEGDHLGPTLSFRGLDNASYYLGRSGNARFNFDVTGCGNTLNVAHPFVKQLIMDSLRYWVEVMQVDGFRFDLASSLLRDDRKVSVRAGLLQMIQQDPVLSAVKLIAEPWDTGRGGYRLGQFPYPWREWNDKFRNGVRQFWTAQGADAGQFATRLAGSSDLFRACRRPPSSSINYVTCHDGFTLEDLVSYTIKRNAANGEQNKDGSDANYSTNCGEEGPTTCPDVRARRDQLKRSLLSTLLLSQGVPMLLGGDELGRTQGGNNNPYCQDNEVSWYHWAPAARDKELAAFMGQLIALRKAYPELRRIGYLTGEASDDGTRDVVWWHPDRRAMTPTDWRNSRVFGMQLSRLLVLFNATGEVCDFRLPDPPCGGDWIGCIGLNSVPLGTSVEVPASGVVVAAAQQGFTDRSQGSTA
ncbi:MAG: glycogen debranching protein GlgX [Bacteroidota bacterium]|nr:glycogen debranching protein GlgX [Bacteroidota bacterium]